MLYISFKTFLETSYDLDITNLFNKAHLQSNTHPNKMSTQILHPKPCPLETLFIHMQFHIHTSIHSKNSLHYWLVHVISHTLKPKLAFTQTSHVLLN